MGVSQIGNGDFPLNNCAILRQILPDTSIDFLTTVLRGEAFANPIANLAGSVRGKIGSALAKIGSLGGANNSASWLAEMSSTLQSFNTQLVDFESRTNRMSGVITGFQDGQPDMGRILGIGSAYNSALATLATKPQDILKDNFSHGFNSLKQEFGINAITESDNALEAAGNFLAQFGLGTTDPGAGTPIEPNPFQFYSEANQILGNIRSIQQSIVNITSAEDAFLAGALAFLDKYALANTALNGVLTDPCQIGKVIKDLAASPDLTNLIPSLSIPEPPTLDEILSNIPDPEDIGNAIKDSVEGIVESVQEQVEQLIDDAVAIGKETVEAIQKSAEELIAAGEALVQQAEQAAADLATNVENFGKDVEKFFEDLENRLDEEEEPVQEGQQEVSEESTEQPVSEGGETRQQRIDRLKSYQSQVEGILELVEWQTDIRRGGGLVGPISEYLAEKFPLFQLENALEWDRSGVNNDPYLQQRVVRYLRNRNSLEDAINIKKGIE